MSLQNLINTKLVSCSPKTTVIEAARLMKDHNVGTVLAVDETGKPVGIITDRDIAIRCVSEDVKCAKTLVNDVMSTPLSTINAWDGIYNAIQVIKKTGARRIPVVDENGKAVAIISFGDILQMLGQEFSDLIAYTTEKKKLLQDVA